MGRGRAKAKQTKVARDLKYRQHETDFGALARELHGDEGTDQTGQTSPSGTSGTSGTSEEDHGDEWSDYADPRRRD